MKRALMIAIAAALAGPAAANDSVAETSAGGLVLARSAEIDMVSEDLFVSADEVRVRYVFRNRAPRDVRAIVAFPLPDEDLSETIESDVAIPTDFRTVVDGSTVEMMVEHKAMLDGRDHSALLEGLKIPLSNDDPEHLGGIDGELDALGRADQDRLVRIGLAAVRSSDPGTGARRLVPLWTVKESWYWEQLFPAGRDLVVEHRYKPGTGGSVGTALAWPDFRNSADVRAMAADFCIDSSFLAGVDRLARKAGDGASLPELRIGYILTTGANWRAPIGSFRLVVDKGAPENLVSFCGDGVRKIGPTRFEMRRTNWRPDRDLKVLIVKPAGSGM
jgi:hypothetical protein